MKFAQIAKRVSLFMIVNILVMLTISLVVGVVLLVLIGLQKLAVHS